MIKKTKIARQFCSLAIAVLLNAGAPALANDWAAAALERIKNPPRGLPSVPVPADNPVTVEKLRLGKKLFFDQRLSKGNTMSCALCHLPDQGFGNTSLPTTIGVAGKFLKRNAPSIFNSAYQKNLFHDGREATLENQIYGPLLSPLEMGNPSIGWVLETINGLEDYWGKFEAVFGTPVNVRNLGQALATYERSIISANSQFDKWLYGKNETALNQQEIFGYELFRSKAQCSRCHKIGDKHALFLDDKFHDTGMSILSKQPDIGRMAVTGRKADRYKFRTPTLRNIALTSPYMHDGSLKTLEAVVKFYNKGHAEIDADTGAIKMPALHLSDKEQAAIVAFLKSLTGDNIQSLINQAQSTSK